MVAPAISSLGERILGESKIVTLGAVEARG